MPEGGEATPPTVSDQVIAELNARITAWKPRKNKEGTPLVGGGVSVGDDLVGDLEDLIAAREQTVAIVENDIQPRELPGTWNPELRKRVWEEDEVRKFYQDPDNWHRTLFCPKINNDLTDGWGMFGYAPGYIFIRGSRYPGARSIADESMLLATSYAIDEDTGMGLLPHFDSFPYKKLNFDLITKTEDPKLFDLMCDMVAKKLTPESHASQNITAQHPPELMSATPLPPTQPQTPKPNI